jgi:hypothetical protein
LATADDLNGDPTNTATYADVSGTDRVLVLQAIGTAGTAGIDVIQLSKDGGSEWFADDTILALASNDVTGTVLANGALNAAGVEPTGAAQVFKSGPHTGPTLMRVVRDATVDANSAAWVTGAPSVTAILVGD